MYYLCTSKFVLELIFILLWIVSAEFAKLEELKELIPVNTCPIKTPNGTSLFILFEINPSEGFNLRRDVYLRFAVFANYLRRSARYKYVKLVLPPFPRLHHWKSGQQQQENIPWSTFFDMASLQEFAPVIDYKSFVRGISDKNIPITVFKLKQFKDTITSGRFIDKFEFKPCAKDETFQYPLLTQTSLEVRSFNCLFFQGSVNSLKDVLNKVINNNTWSKTKTYGFLSAEIVLHDQWGSREYWMGRKSMQFNKKLVQIASKYQKQNFGIQEIDEKAKNGVREKIKRPFRDATEGGYLCIHLRRGDFIIGREKTTPSLKSTAIQIKRKLKGLNLTSVFISSDCSDLEFENLKVHLKGIGVYRFSTKKLKLKSILDGAIAIIDQIICSYSSYFIGTFGSTFTYRIYEEREILGFPSNMTFNTLCKNSNLENCSKNAVWPIVN